MTADELREPGFYWYRDEDVGPVIAEFEVWKNDRASVAFSGDDVERTLDELNGQFVGPLSPPEF